MFSSSVLGTLFVGAAAAAVRGATIHAQVDVLSQESAPHGGIATEAGTFPVKIKSASLIISYLIAPCTEIGLTILKDGGNAADAVCDVTVWLARRLRSFDRSSLQVFVSESSLPIIPYVDNFSFGTDLHNIHAAGNRWWWILPCALQQG